MIDRLCGSLSLAMLAGVSTLAVAAAVPAYAQERTRAFDIPEQALSSALMAYSRTTDTPVMARMELLDGKRAPAVRGSMSEQAALARLLEGSGLRATQGAGGGLMLVRIEPDPQGASAGVGAETSDVDALIVTAQKREEAIQDVPIAISAFTQQALDDQKIEGGYDLLKAVPNVTFSKSNYSSYNFSVRGVGTKAVSATSDPGVAVSFNNVPLLRNRLFEQEYFDVERVEVLRGPQGTLYGRNATGGVVNMITAKPDLNDFSAQVKAEIGNYDARRLSGMVNVPLVDDVLAVRVAGAMTQRSGYGVNLTTGQDTDNRDLWSGRVSVAFEPTDRIRTSLIWEHFEEDDARLRTGKQLCHRDDGPSDMLNVQTYNDDGTPAAIVSVPDLDVFARGRLSQGCKIGSLYEDAAFGTPNGMSLPFSLLLMVDLASAGWSAPEGDPTRVSVPPVRRGVDAFGGLMQSRDMRAIESIIEPEYRGKADVFAFNVDVDLSDYLTLTSQTAYNKDEVYSLQDYNRFATVPFFTNTDGLYGSGSEPTTRRIPGGFYTDPQIGPSDTLKGFEISSSKSTQFSQEFRLQSSFDGPLNFSAGVNYLRFKGVNDYYLFLNVVTMLAEIYYNGGGPYNPDHPNHVYVDYGSFDNLSGDGHNYFRNQNPYRLDSRAVFGEVYWEAAEDLKITAGLRYTDDYKVFTPWPSRMLVQSPHGPYAPTDDIVQDWQEVTGRLGVDWKPALSFTDQTLVYGFYSRGYKGGGANPPPAMNPNRYLQAVTPATFDPEFVDAYEIGTKNTLLGGALTLNGSAFYYDYKDYQVSKVVDRTVVNEGFDATMWGLELETLWRPTRNLRLNANVGYLRTKIADGETSLDIFNRTQNDPDWMVVIPWPQQTSNCILPKSEVARRLAQGRMFKPFLGDRFGGDAYAMLTACGDFWLGLNSTDPSSNLARYPQANGGAGFLADVGGNELPNAPRWTLSLGAEYTIDLPSGWEATIRGDYYRQADSWARVYAEVSDRLQGWENANLSLTLERPDSDLVLQVYAKNLFDDTPITDAFLNSDSTGMTTNVFTLDPRLIGFSVRKGF